MLQKILTKIFSRKTRQTVTYPEFVNEYLSHFDQPVQLNIPIEEATFTVIDTETTGLNTSKDNIISFGGVNVKNKTIDLSESVSVYFTNVLPTNKDAIQIHGTLPNQSHGLDETAAIEKILGIIKNNVIVGHHIGFDILMINKLLQKHKFPILRNKVLDTSQLKKRTDHSPFFQQNTGSNQHSLDDLCREYNVVTHHRHTAAGDSFITALVFIKLIRILQKRGISTLKDLLRS